MSNRLKWNKIGVAFVLCHGKCAYSNILSHLKCVYVQSAPTVTLSYKTPRTTTPTARATATASALAPAPALVTTAITMMTKTKTRSDQIGLLTEVGM